MVEVRCVLPGPGRHWVDILADDALAGQLIVDVQR